MFWLKLTYFLPSSLRSALLPSIQFLKASSCLTRERKQVIPSQSENRLTNHAARMTGSAIHLQPSSHSTIIQLAWFWVLKLASFSSIWIQSSLIPPYSFPLRERARMISSVGLRERGRESFFPGAPSLNDVVRHGPAFSPLLAARVAEWSALIGWFPPLRRARRQRGKKGERKRSGARSGERGKIGRNWAMTPKNTSRILAATSLSRVSSPLSSLHARKESERE